MSADGGGYMVPPALITQIRNNLANFKPFTGYLSGAGYYLAGGTVLQGYGASFDGNIWPPPCDGWLFEAWVGDALLVTDQAKLVRVDAFSTHQEAMVEATLAIPDRVGGRTRYRLLNSSFGFLPKWEDAGLMIGGTTLTVCQKFARSWGS